MALTDVLTLIGSAGGLLVLALMALLPALLALPLPRRTPAPAATPVVIPEQRTAVHEPVHAA